MPEYIEREALIKAVRIMPRTIRPELVRYSTVQAIIDKQPSADVVEVVHGEWIEGKTLETCSVCGKKGFPDWKYCPNCGAKMDGEKNG